MADVVVAALDEVASLSAVVGSSAAGVIVVVVVVVDDDDGEDFVAVVVAVATGGEVGGGAVLGPSRGTVTNSIRRSGIRGDTVIGPIVPDAATEEGAVAMNSSSIIIPRERDAPMPLSLQRFVIKGLRR